MKDKSRRISDSMIADYEKKMYACMDSGSGDGSGDGDMDDEWLLDERGDRYDANDPCRAARQLTRNMQTWSRRFNVHLNCETGLPDPDAENEF